MPRPPRRAAGVPAVLLLAALAACGTGEGPPEAVRDSAGAAARASTTIAAPVPPTSTTVRTGGAGGTTTTAGRATSTTRAGAGSATSSTPAVGRALTPAAPGTYRFDTTGATTFSLAAAQPFPAVTTLVVDPASGTIQHSTRNLRDAAGNGPATELTLDYRPQGVYLVALRLTVGVAGASDSEELRPPVPVLLLATGARPGAHTEADLAAGTSGAKLVVDVLRDERVAVAGKGVDTLVMQAVVTLAPGDVTGRLQLTVNLDPVSRLWVKEQSVTDASAAGGVFQLHSQYTATIQRLTP